MNGTCCHCSGPARGISSHSDSLENQVPLLNVAVLTEEQKAERRPLSLQKIGLRRNHSKDRTLWPAVTVRKPEE